MVKSWKVEKQVSYSDVVLSGDLSYSNHLLSGEVHVHRKIYQKLLHPLISSSKHVSWALIFSRKDNFGPGKGIWISGEQVRVEQMIGGLKVFDIEQVVFASADELEDYDHMQRLKKEFHLHRDRVHTCRSVEEMFGLISLAPEVITDRYHPGVVSLIQGIKLTITKYQKEEIKLTGLIKMTNYTKAEVEDMNDKAFISLLNIIQGRRR